MTAVILVTPVTADPPPAAPPVDPQLLARLDTAWDLHHDPVAFARDVLGVDLWSRQREIARAVRDHARVAVRSCHAAGKTLVAAVCACWFLYTHRDAIVLTTASTFRQVRYVFWRTIQGLVTGAARPLGGELLDTELRLGERWYGLGLSTDNPERFQGFHAPHLLVVVDEPGAIPPGVFAAIEGVLASGRTRLLMIGNPTQPDGPFYDAFHAQAGAYRTFRISAFDTPNFLPRDDDRAYLVSPEWVEMRRRLWGADSDLYRARVLGEFPRQAADGLFSLSTLDAAATPGDALPDDGAADPGSAHPACPERSRREALPSGVEGPVEGPSHPPSPSPPMERGLGGEATPPRAALGVDVARFGDDATAFSWIEDGCLVRQQELRGQSLMETAGRIVEALQERPDLAVAVDDTGLGGGVTDRLREQGWEPMAINFGAAAGDRDHYANRAAELYSRLARALEQGELRFQPDLPSLDALVGQLTAVRYALGSDGRRRVHKRGLAGGPAGGIAARRASPDLADSLALAWAAYEEGTLGPGVY